MARPTNQKKDLSGIELYSYNGMPIEEFPTFLYEVCIYKYWKFGACLLESKFITSDNLLKIKQDSECKYVNYYIIEKSITLLGAPRDFIQNLKKYQLNPKKK